LRCRSAWPAAFERETAFAMMGDAERAQNVAKPIDTRALPKLVASYVERSNGRTLN
jgi:hypothetical protein